MSLVDSCLQNDSKRWLPPWLKGTVAAREGLGLSVREVESQRRRVTKMFSGV